MKLSPWRRLIPLVLLVGILTGCGGSEQKPVATDAGSSEMGSMAMPATGRKININTAILSELDRLEGLLGVPALSDRIQASRPYASVDELVSKRVVTQAQFDQIRGLLTVEDIVLTGEARDVDYLTKLGLMRGHLRVARELLERKQPQAALPHFGHPVEEIYLDLEPQLAERGVPEFKTQLLQLQEQIKFAPDDPKVIPNLEAALAAISRAEAAVSEAERNQPEFVLQVISGLLDAASAEYGAAIDGERVAARIEYEDSRGFILYSRELYQRIAEPLAKTAPEQAKAVAANLDKLATAWPAIEAPAKPVLAPAAVQSSVRAIAEATAKVPTA